MTLEACDLEGLHRGLAHCRAGDYYAAHDAWEEVWRGLHGRPRIFWQAMIQFVVGMYHWGNGNLRGCRGQWQKALQKCVALAQMYDTEVPPQIPLLHDMLCDVLALVEEGDDPQPLMRHFVTSVMSETWFAFA